MVRFVHTGDMHLDSPFRGLPRGIAQLRKEEQRKTFLKLVEETKTYGADMLLIAGDMFDGSFVSEETVAFIKDAFARISDTAVFIAPGNHDYLEKNSPYLTENLGENVRVFRDTFEAFTVGDCIVYGYGFPARFIKESVLSTTPLHQGAGPGILLIHGDVAGESDYNPISPVALENTGVSYAALGHVHTYSGLLKAGETTYAYPGIPEGRHFDEAGQGGYIRGEITEDGVKAEFVPISLRQNITLSVDITGLSTMEAIREKIAGQLSHTHLYTIVLEGETEGTFYMDTGLLQKMLKETCLFCKIKDNTKVRAEGMEASLLEKLFIEKLSGKVDAVSQKALRFGLEAFRRRGK